MDFAYSERSQQYRERVSRFMDDHVFPAEAAFFAEVEANRKSGNAWIPTAVVESLKEKAQAAGLWNLFLPESADGQGSATWNTRAV